MSLYGKGSGSPWGQGSQGSAGHERPAPVFLGAPGTHGKAWAPGLSRGLVLKGSVRRGVVCVSVMPPLALGRERVPRAGGASCALGRPRAPPGGGAQPAGAAPGPVLQETRPRSCVAFIRMGQFDVGTHTPTCEG